MRPTLDHTEQSRTIDEWRRAVHSLLSEIAEWAEQAGWRVDSYEVERDEEALDPYTVPAIQITTPDGQLRLEPIARIVFGGRGTVELRAMPTLFRVRLVRRSDADEWVILTDSGVPLHQEWNRDNFVRLANDLLRTE